MTNFRMDIGIDVIEETLPAMLIVIATAFLTRPYVKLKKLKIDKCQSHLHDLHARILVISITPNEDILRHEFDELEHVLVSTSIVLTNEYSKLKEEVITTVN